MTGKIYFTKYRICKLNQISKYKICQSHICHIFVTPVTPFVTRIKYFFGVTNGVTGVTNGVTGKKYYFGVTNGVTGVTNM